MLTRIITGVVGIALAAFIIQTGGQVFGIAVLVLMLIGWHEYAQAFRHFGQPLAYYSGAFFVAFLGTCAWLGNASEFLAIAVLATLWTMSQAVVFHRDFSVAQAVASVAGIVYVGFTFSHLILLRFWNAGTTMETSAGPMEAGCAWIWVALIGTWASDTFAYFTGSAFGRHKLCEAVSPKKTIEGFIGGVVGTMASVAGVGAFLSLPALPMAGLGLCIALAATIGDLVESVIKRYTGIKDSGVLIPGHGGVLDRFDSVMFVVPFVYYFVQVYYHAG